jgi:citrate synthase
VVVVNGEEYMTVDEAARLLGVKRATLYAYVSRGVLRSYRQGIKRQRLYRRSEITGLIQLAPSGAAEGGDRRAPRRLPRDIPLAESWIRD